MLAPRRPDLINTPGGNTELPPVPVPVARAPVRTWLLGCPCRKCMTHAVLALGPGVRPPAHILCPRCSQTNCPQTADHHNACRGDVHG